MASFRRRNAAESERFVDQEQASHASGFSSEQAMASASEYDFFGIGSLALALIAAEFIAAEFIADDEVEPVTEPEVEVDVPEELIVTFAIPVAGRERR